MMNKYFEVTIKALKMEGDCQRKVSEKYLFNTISFADGEKEAVKELSPYVDGEFEVTDITIRKFAEVILTDDEEADKFYKVMISLITLDEKTNAEKKTKSAMLVQASDLRDAIRRTEESMRGSVTDYAYEGVCVTSYKDVFKNIETT